MIQFKTKTGCNVTVAEDEKTFGHLGDGVMMIGRVGDSTEWGRFEVFLDDDALLKLEEFLKFRREDLNGCRSETPSTDSS